jgi:hypothetical protein
MTDLLTAETCFLAASPVAENVNNKPKKKKKGIQWCSALIKKFILAQNVKKLPIFYKTNSHPCVYIFHILNQFKPYLI